MSCNNFQIYNDNNNIKSLITEELENAPNITILPGGDFEYSMPSGYLFKTNNTIATPIAVQDQPVKAVLSDNQGLFLNEMVVQGINRLQYTGDRTRSFMITCNISAHLDSAAGNNRVCAFLLYKNGAAIAGAIITMNLRESVNIAAGSITVPVWMAKNDYIELWVENTENSADIIINTLGYIAWGMSSTTSIAAMNGVF